MDCIFCKIIAGDVKSDILFQDNRVIAIPDINPKAPVHLLVISKDHLESLAHLTDNEEPLLGHMIAVANRLARDNGVSEKGYRLVFNSGPHGGQVVPHLHLHLLGGRQLGILG